MKKVKLILDGKELTANFEDNQTAMAMIEKMPLQLDMMNLYARELTYRFSQALPANEAHTAGYAVGDIAYWTPRHSFVIFYQQTGEVISDLQKVGHINDPGILSRLHMGSQIQLTLKKC
ncbi:cyclophilin-like fold protein [Levilactobacillus huananensis]|uniref:cyclophilin-like fold protein n=1 Tax=Levilactobacillus huananensis TaxID=2486019 RepID=UPI000F76F03B|nr:cyclophilin-like fold protein [Levilactobacillus huananensis]